MKKLFIIFITGTLIIGFTSCTPDELQAQTTTQSCCGDDEPIPPPPPPPPPNGGN